MHFNCPIAKAALPQWIILHFFANIKELDVIAKLKTLQKER